VLVVEEAEEEQAEKEMSRKVVFVCLMNLYWETRQQRVDARKQETTRHLNIQKERLQVLN